MANKYLVVTDRDIYAVPPGEALIWAILSDLSEGPTVFHAFGAPLPRGALDIRAENPEMRAH